MVRHPFLKIAGALLLTTLIGTVASPAWGAETWLNLGLGFGPLRHPPRQLFLALEVEHLVVDRRFSLWLAAEGNAQGRWVGGGLALRRPLGRRLEGELSFGPGFYPDLSHLDLGSRLQFRSSASLVIHLGTRVYVKLSATHVSDGGISRHNPGVETVRLVLGLPLGQRR